jgi:hypothetical protein
MTDSSDPLRREIAATAARLIADGGLDYASAKRKAVRQLTGNANSARGSLPDNDEIDAALADHLSIFDDGHAERVSRRRQVAMTLMSRLAPFHPYLTGAVWKGIVAEHAPIHLQLFHDNPKDVEIYLLNEGVRFDVETTQHFRNGDEIEAIVLWWDNEPVLLSLYDERDLRGALRGGLAGPERGNLAALRLRVAADDKAAAQSAAGSGQ